MPCESRFRIRTAVPADQKDLADIAKTHRAGQGFTHMMFSGEAAYAKGWIRVVEDYAKPGPDGRPTIIAFTCVRQKVTVPKTMLYYIIIAPTHRREGLGTLLLGDLKSQSPHRIIECSCLKDNAEALAFYDKHGFKMAGTSLKGKGWHLELAW